MGKKEASSLRAPVEQYRKQIGKHDYKKSKTLMKETKMKATQRKSSSHAQDMMVMVFTGATILMVLYALLYYTIFSETTSDIGYEGDF
ncbi:triple QxxK/R motif-containing protein [Lampetra fluviatilis]